MQNLMQDVNLEFVPMRLTRVTRGVDPRVHLPSLPSPRAGEGREGAGLPGQARQ